MARINLAARNGAERRILDYLEANASEALAEKINAGRKTLADALKYCEGEARKLQGGGKCVCVEDATVFGWAVHFFEEAAVGNGQEAVGPSTGSGQAGSGQAVEEAVGNGQEAVGNKQNAVGNGEEAGNPFDGLSIFGGGAE